MSGTAFRRESWRHQNTFETYLLLGPSRTLRELARVTNVRRVTLQAWSKNYGWDVKLAKRDEKAMSVLQKENDEIYVNAIRLRHQEAYKLGQEKAVEMLEKFGKRKSAKGRFLVEDGRDLRDTVMALDVSAKGEREVMGMSQSKVRGMKVKEGVATLVEAIFNS